LNERRGLDHGDSSEDLLRVALVASGPDFRKGKVVRDAVESIDVCPTIAKIFGAPAESARGKVLKGLFA
jgi:arylsulfatase A-like enzyme